MFILCCMGPCVCSCCRGPYVTSVKRGSVTGGSVFRVTRVAAPWRMQSVWSVVGVCGNKVHITKRVHPRNRGLFVTYFPWQIHYEK